MFLKGKEREKGTGRERVTKGRKRERRDLLCPGLVPKGPQGNNQKLHRVPHVGARDPSTWAIFCYSPRCNGNEAGSEAK